MTVTNIKRLLPVLTVPMLVLGSAGTGSAAVCTSEFMQCYSDASTLGDWLARSAAGLDCEYSYAGCLREALFGF